MNKGIPVSMNALHKSAEKEDESFCDSADVKAVLSDEDSFFLCSTEGKCLVTEYRFSARMFCSEESLFPY